MLKIIYEDSDIMVVWKPVGVESQESRGFGADMVSEIRNYLRRTQGREKQLSELSTKQSTKPVDIYVGVIHRLDKPVSGLLIYAKTKRAAARLSEQIVSENIRKKYLAVFCGKVDKNVDNLVDYLLKDGKTNTSAIVDKNTAGAKRAELSYRVLEELETEAYGTLSLAEITLKTGRHHQIRVQMSGNGLPLWGDNKYNPKFRQSRVNVALAAYELSFTHPVTGKIMSFCKMPEADIFQKFSYVREKSSDGSM